MSIIIIFLSFLSSFILAGIISALIESEGMEFVNPIWLYRRFKVNWFGAICIALIFNTVTLPCAIIYWLYKLCKVGRK